MPEVTYTEARANFARLWDRIVEDREAVLVQRRGKEPLALLPASDLAALVETVHLLRSPRNAERLLTALARAREGGGPQETTDDLKREVGLG